MREKSPCHADNRMEGEMSEEIASAAKTFHRKVQQNHIRTHTYRTPAVGTAVGVTVLLSGSLGSLSRPQHLKAAEEGTGPGEKGDA